MCNYKGRCTLASVAMILMVIGALNWGLVGIGYFFGGNWNLVNLLLGNWMWLEALIYVLVGAAGVMSLFHCKCATCGNAMKDHAHSVGGGQQMDAGMH